MPIFHNMRFIESIISFQVTTFSTVEDFWALYNHIEFASKLGMGCDYSLFKQGIKPMWEDPLNKDGGRWLISVDKRYRAAYLDTFWLEIMMCLIGKWEIIQFYWLPKFSTFFIDLFFSGEAYSEFGNIVNGAVVNVRAKGDKISLWLSESVDRQAIMSVGKVIKSRLGLEFQICFEVHKDNMNKNSSAIRSKYIIWSEQTKNFILRESTKNSSLGENQQHTSYSDTFQY